MTLGLFFFAVNGPVAKLALINGLESAELSAFRIEGAFFFLLVSPKKKYSHLLVMDFLV